MLWSATPAGTIQDAQQHLWEQLGMSGSGVARMLAEDEDFAAALARFASHGGHQTALPVDEAMKIMRRNFLGWGSAKCVADPGDLPEGIQRYVPYTAGTLEKHHNTHTLVAVPHVSIKEFRNRFTRPDKEPRPMFWENFRFAIKQGTPGWYLIRTMPRRDTCGEHWEDQVRSLRSDEVVVPARIAAFAAACDRSVRGTVGCTIYRECYVRCEARASDGHHIVIGDTGGHLLIRNDPDGSQNSRLGLATMIRPEP